MDGRRLADGGIELAIGLQAEHPADMADILGRERAGHPGVTVRVQARKGERRFLVMVTKAGWIIVQSARCHCLGTQRRERRSCQKCGASQKGCHRVMGGIDCPSHGEADVSRACKESNS
ncbi:hypothetical protein AA0616_0486 [Komagataeibacter nataicola NRIC 0616]|nr:hypothetical protein AA0616_0486 [Komagataeibacter nataicola NRIC 0616]